MTSISPPCLRINGRAVVVLPVLPPIPTNRWDYSASFADDETVIAYGPTPLAAVTALQEIDDESRDQ
jgi:hypothetical protein